MINTLKENADYFQVKSGVMPINMQLLARSGIIFLTIHFFPNTFRSLDAILKAINRDTYIASDGCSRSFRQDFTNKMQDWLGMTEYFEILGKMSLTPRDVIKPEIKRFIQKNANGFLELTKELNERLTKRDVAGIPKHFGTEEEVNLAYKTIAAKSSIAKLDDTEKIVFEKNTSANIQKLIESMKDPAKLTKQIQKNPIVRNDIVEEIKKS